MQRSTFSPGATALAALFAALALCVASTGAAAGAPPANPDTWYVSPSGDDSADGSSPATAKATLAAAFTPAEAGDTIVMLAGDHPAASLGNIGGSANAPIAVVGQGAARIVGSGTPALTLAATHDLLISGISFSATVNAIAADSTDNVELADLDVSQVGGAALVVTGSTSGLSVAGSRIVDTAGEAVQIAGAVDGMRIHNNTIAGSGANAAAAIDVRATAANGMEISANTIGQIAAGSGAGSAIHLDAPAHVVNNVIVDVPGSGLAVNAPSTVVEHNTVFGTGAPLTDTTGGSISVVNNLGIDRPGNLDAKANDFIDANAGDLRLVASSQAVDSASASSVTTDRDGRTRPRGEGPDVGAYESPHTKAPASTSTTTAPVVESETPAEPDADSVPTAVGEPANVERDLPPKRSEPREASSRPAQPDGDVALGDESADGDASVFGKGDREPLRLSTLTGSGADPDSLEKPPGLSRLRIGEEPGDEFPLGALAVGSVVAGAAIGAVLWHRRRQPTADHVDA